MFFHSSVAEHLSCVYILAIVSTATVTCMYLYLFEYPLSIILDTYLDLKVEFRGPYCNLCLTFKEPVNVFSPQMNLFTFSSGLASCVTLCGCQHIFLFALAVGIK